MGTARLDWPIPAEGMTVGELLAALAKEYPALRGLLASSRIFLDGELLSGTHDRVQPGHEVTVHPPYGGG